MLLRDGFLALVLTGLGGSRGCEVPTSPPPDPGAGGGASSTGTGGTGGDAVGAGIGGSGGEGGVGTGGAGGGDGAMGGAGGAGGNPNVCGDGIVGDDESCDDGNTAYGDGCDPQWCMVEHAYACTGSPSICVTVCGDGLRASVEACDDGNTVNGDGCDATCEVEPGFVCGEGEPSACCAYDEDVYKSNVPLGQLVCGSISAAGEVDEYVFTLPTTGDVHIETFDGAGPGSCRHPLDTLIRLYAADGQTQISWSDDGGIGGCSRIDGIGDEGGAKDPAAIGLPAGTYVLRVERYPNDGVIPAYTLLIEATVCGDGLLQGSEPCDGGASCDANCQVTAAGVGESIETAEPLPACPMSYGSEARLHVPSCFPPEGAVHWYSHVAADKLLVVTADAEGPVALFDENGELIECAAPPTDGPLATVSKPGKTYHVAVATPTPITCLTIEDRPYHGLVGDLTDLGVTFSSGAASARSMTFSATHVYMGTPTRVFVFPKSGNTMATVYGTANGLTTAHLGDDLLLFGDSLFSLSTAGSTQNWIWRIHDVPTNTWGPTAWDLSPNYAPNSPSLAMATDGTTLFYVTRGSDGVDPGQVEFYALSPAAPAQAQIIGSTTQLHLATGLAVDAQHFYVAAVGAGGYGVYRLARADLAAPPTKIAHLRDYLGVANTRTTVVLDDVQNAAHLYARDEWGDIRVVIDPGGDALDAGVLMKSISGHSDDAMGYDGAEGVLYLYAKDSLSTGRAYKMH
ncbi:DVUA0089 family protein [Polyangium sp. y55x31]|uniref:DVUA0089 family protein n=1 Tax=Polyangium sp. y55x31 TaxID=3042688 RepID=UPI0024821222|nr:DVUA0089 family protein [Polyangium sp. y55x31]MDI1482724.1 DVUA0089 family protein [Polyangium sp. y55x31]